MLLRLKIELMKIYQQQNDALTRIWRVALQAFSSPMAPLMFYTNKQSTLCIALVRVVARKSS